MHNGRQSTKNVRQAGTRERITGRQAGRQAKSQKVWGKIPKCRPPTQISNHFPRANFFVEWGYYPKIPYIYQKINMPTDKKANLVSRFRLNKNV